MSFFGPAISMAFAVVGSLFGSFSAFGYLMVETCGVSDVTERFPADASFQGWACGAGADNLWYVPAAWGVALSAVLAVVLVVAFWSRGGSWRWLCPLPVVLAPVATVLLFSLPPDTCTEEARTTHTAYQCATQVEG